MFHIFSMYYKVQKSKSFFFFKVKTYKRKMKLREYKGDEKGKNKKNISFKNKVLEKMLIKLQILYVI